MKTLVLKEVRENVKVAVVGLIIYTRCWWGSIAATWCRPRTCRSRWCNRDLLTETGWFCALFGAVLGWLQIHNERRPDLWAFLLHRPVTRTTIFLGKALAGLGHLCGGGGRATVGLRCLGAVAGPCARALRAGHAAAGHGLRACRDRLLFRRHVDGSPAGAVVRQPRLGAGRRVCAIGR